MEVVSALPNRAAASHWSPLAAELLEGLASPQKYINPKFFYDERGSQLFDQITSLPEYYPTRAEISILQKYAGEIASCVGEDAVLIEPGAGSCEKVCYLLDALKPAVYFPQDISADFLYSTVKRLRMVYPWLKARPLIGDFADVIELPDNMPGNRRLIFYPGSTIGNFDPPVAIDFLRSMRRLVGNNGGLIIGVDLQKDPVILNAAYNDTAGVTAKFNQNILEHVNSLLGSAIDSQEFSHHAFYNEQKHRIEMHLICKNNQTINCHGIVLNFTKGETIHTESSYKYTQESFAALAVKAGFELRQTWLDDEGLFSVHYLE